MISIDDLLKQRLGNAEEKERDGAWLRMQELLDQQMPQNKVAPVQWRRMLGLVAGAALLATVSLGGYEVVQSFRNGGTPAAKDGQETAMVIAKGGVASSAIDALPEVQKAGNDNQQAPESASDGAGTANTVNETTHTSTAQQTSEHNVAKSEDQKVTQDKAPVVAQQHNISNNSATQNKPQQNNNNSNKNDHKVVPAASVGNVVNNTKAASQAINANSADANIATKPAVVSADKAEGNTPVNQPANTTTVNKNNSVQGGIATAAVNRKKEEPVRYAQTGGQETMEVSKPEFVKEKVVVDQIVRQEKYTKEGKLKMDTIYNGKTEMEVLRPAEKNEQLALNNDGTTAKPSNAEVLPNAAAQNKKEQTVNEESNLVPLSEKKVASRKMKNYNPARFEEMVENAKFRLSRVKFYPGLVVGGNLPLSKSGVVGAQAGLAMNMTVSERWSVLTELKGIYRFNTSGKTNLQDDYITNVKSVYQNGQQYYYYDSMEHNYNFTNYMSVEMPVAVNYNVNRLNFFGGANLVYNFRINNVEEIDRPYLVAEKNVSTNPGVLERQGDKKILLSDFTPSFNIGYVVGFGYQVTPASKLDLRLTQPIWNNANTFGEKQISKQFYNMPKLQFNYTFRFSSNKPYKRKPKY